MKERLTGAIILVALIVLLVPELLTGPVRSSTVPQTAATSSEEPPLRSYTINLADDTRTGRSTTSVGGTAAPDGVGEPAPQANPSAVTESTEPLAGSGTGSTPGAPVAGSGATSGPSGPTSSDGAETGPGRAPATSQTAATGGATAPTPSGSATPQHPRVPEAPARAAPPPHSAQAHSAHSTSAAKTSPESAVGEGAAAHGSGWVVQLGVFASRGNADRLAQELKGKGFRISVSEIAGSGRTLFRVRAGPVSDRTAASELAVKLRAAGAPGSVVPRN